MPRSNMIIRSDSSPEQIYIFYFMGFILSLPGIQLMRKQNVEICLGTESMRNIVWLRGPIVIVWCQNRLTAFILHESMDVESDNRRFNFGTNSFSGYPRQNADDRKYLVNSPREQFVTCNAHVRLEQNRYHMWAKQTFEEFRLNDERWICNILGKWPGYKLVAILKKSEG